MKATDWEFSNRALLFGLIFAVSFPLYSLDPTNSTDALANWLGPLLRTKPDLTARLLLAGASLLLALAAFLRTWASAYLHAGIVYASELHAESLVADGPYRYVRNPLYCANVLMAVGMGAMMSRAGFLVAVAGMLLFNYRLIFREEAGLRATQGDSYRNYCAAVPRLFPSPWPRIASAGGAARWSDGFRAESWYWGFAAAVGAFAITFSLPVFFGILAASLVLFWVAAARMRKKSKA